MNSNFSTNSNNKVEYQLSRVSSKIGIKGTGFCPLLLQIDKKCKTSSV